MFVYFILYLLFCFVLFVCGLGLNSLYSDPGRVRDNPQFPNPLVPLTQARSKRTLQSQMFNVKYNTRG
jgi:hypothetical protein